MYEYIHGKSHQRRALRSSYITLSSHIPAIVLDGNIWQDYSLLVYCLYLEQTWSLHKHSY